MPSCRILIVKYKRAGVGVGVGIFVFLVLSGTVTSSPFLQEETTTNAEINVASNKELAVFILNNY